MCINGIGRHFIMLFEQVVFALSIYKSQFVQLSKLLATIIKGNVDGPI